jgi:hypothetical protein
VFEKLSTVTVTALDKLIIPLSEELHCNSTVDATASSLPTVSEAVEVGDDAFIRLPDPVRIGLSENDGWVDRPEEDWIQNLCVACEQGKDEVRDPSRVVPSLVL